MANTMYDFVIIGAGSAGCVLADRLTADGKFKVALIEAGGSDQKFWLRTPIGYGHSFYNKDVNWKYVAQPDPGLAGRADYWPRGKVLGGSSSINAMVFIRGAREDFDEWAALGNTGWSYDDVLPVFKSMEDNEAGADEWRGTGGPLHVADVTSQVHPLNENFIQAGEALGFPRNPDFNGASQEGLGIFQINTKNGRRMSASRAFLDRAINRSNLNVIDNAHVTKLGFTGPRATRVDFVRGNRTRTLYAAQEIILCAGAVNSPQILQRSGVGPSELLERHGIDLVHDMPAVGKHLQDHLGFSYMYRSTVPTLNQQLGNWPGKLLAGARYLLTRTGPLSLSVNQGGGFVRTSPDRERPNAQLYLCPVSYTRTPPGTREMLKPDPFKGFYIGVTQTRPHSEGHIEIASSDPFADPLIFPGGFSDPRDMTEMIEAARLMRALAQTEPLAKVIEAEFEPGPEIETDEQIANDIRERSYTTYHPCSTCRMGTDKSNSVVNERCEVHDLYGLRVVDTSVFPTQISGNTNAATMMIAEKTAAMILEDNEFA